MTSNPDPLNCETDVLYAIYRKGLITRHIAANGRYLETAALERIDDSGQVAGSAETFVTVNHSVPFGGLSRNVRIRVPKTNTRYSEEIDTSAPLDGQEYTVKPMLWAPLIAPIKYPGQPEYEKGRVYRGRSPSLPQTPGRKEYALQKCYYVACSSGDNPGCYGGMALAAFALEALHQVSPHSLGYARALIQGFLTMEMNGRNGYMIRSCTWHAGYFGGLLDVKLVRGASPEELLGIMLGIMYYLKAEVRSHPLYAAAEGLRDRILNRVSQGRMWSAYSHPFMDQSYWMKHFELPLYASKGEERGSSDLYYFICTYFFLDDKDWSQDLMMILHSIVLVLEGDLPDHKKTEWAEEFLRVIKTAHHHLRHGDTGEKEAHHNAYLGVVSLLVNSFLNPQRDCATVGQRFRDIWTNPTDLEDAAAAGRRAPLAAELSRNLLPFVPSVAADPVPGLDLSLWADMVSCTEERIFRCASQDNERAVVDEAFLKGKKDQWQHNLPLLTVIEEITNSSESWRVVDGAIDDFGELWKQHNPHRRLGTFFTWKGAHWFRKERRRYDDYTLGRWSEPGLPALDECGYNEAQQKRYRGPSYLEKEVLRYREHEDTQVEAGAMDLLFLRMLLTHVDSRRYPPPQLPDRGIAYPISPFRGVEPLDPKFVHYEFRYRSDVHGRRIGGDHERSWAPPSSPTGACS